MKPTIVSTVPPDLSDCERKWCMQFKHALELQEILYLSPVAASIQEEMGWIEPYLKNNQLQSTTAISESDCEAIWVLGIGEGLWFDRAFEWLESGKDRFLLIIETKVAHLRFFLRNERWKDRWNHPKIALLLLDPKYEITGESTLKLAAQLLNDTRAMGLSHPSYGHSTSQTIVWNLLRGVISDFQDVKRAYLLTPDLMAHALKNTIHIHLSKFHDRLGDWLDMPVILCGAGPSLNDAIEGLKLMQGKALIISCGTASQVLMNAKIEPDWVAGVCPYFLHYDRFRRIDYLETPTMTGLIVHPGVMRSMSGFKVLLRGLSKFDSVQFLEEIFGSAAASETDYGHSVLTSALKGCVDMGCKKIVLVGVDLCYVNELKYGLGADVVQSAKLEKEGGSAGYSIEINAVGKKVITNAVWLQEQTWLENFLRVHPEIELIQASKKGLPIHGSSNYQAWESLMENQALLVQRDLVGASWQAYQNAPENPKQAQALFLRKLKQRLKVIGSFSIDIMRQVQFLSKEMDVMGSQRLLATYLKRLQEEPLLKGVLLKIDACIATLQIRQFWKMNRDMKMKSINIQKLRKITLIVERMSIMSQRLSQLQEAIEDVEWEQGWDELS